MRQEYWKTQDNLLNVTLFLGRNQLCCCLQKMHSAVDLAQKEPHVFIRYKFSVILLDKTIQ